MTWLISTPLLNVRVLARISKMPVQNSSSKIILNLLQIYFKSLYQLHINAYCVKKAFTHQQCPIKCFVRKVFGYYLQKVKIEIPYGKVCLPRKEVFMKLPVQKTGRTGP